MLETASKTLRKKAQKFVIGTSIAGSMKQLGYSNKQKAEAASEAKLVTVKAKMTTISVSIGNSIKGQFGSQVKETFDKQTNKLKEF